MRQVPSLNGSEFSGTDSPLHWTYRGLHAVVRRVCTATGNSDCEGGTHMSGNGIQKLIDIMQSPWRQTDERIAAAKGLGRSGNEAAGQALADAAHSLWAPVELRTVAAQEAGRALSGRKRRR